MVHKEARIKARIKGFYQILKELKKDFENHFEVAYNILLNGHYMLIIQILEENRTNGSNFSLYIRSASYFSILLDIDI